MSYSHGTGSERAESRGRRIASASLRLGAALAATVVFFMGCGSPATPTTRTLSLVIDGTGSGSLAVAGVQCVTSCDVEVADGEGHTVVASAAADSELVGWGGCDQAMGPECHVLADSHRTVSATFDQVDQGEEPPPDDDPVDPPPDDDPPDEPPAKTGSLEVTFSGLPTGLEGLGHATITSPTGDEYGLLESMTLLDLPVGEYDVAAHGLEVCTSTVHPLSPPASVTIEEDETAQLSISYGGEGLSSQGFRAVIRGIHSNGGEVLGYLTITESGDDVSVLACFSFHYAGDASNASIRHGNPWDVFVEDATVVWSLTPETQSCYTPDVETCYLYLGGVHELSPSELSAFRNGEYYFYIESGNAYGLKLVAQIGSESEAPTPATGAGLVVDVGTMPPELQGYSVCIDGRFTMTEDSYYTQQCIGLNEAGQTVYSDIFSGAYEAFIEPPPGEPSDLFGLVIAGSPAEVRSGEVATISVSFED